MTRSLRTPNFLLVSLLLAAGVLMFPPTCQASGPAFRLLGTVTSGELNDPPDTLVTLDALTGQTALAGPVGQAPHSQSIDLNPATGTLFGVDFFSSPGIVEEIDPRTGIGTAVATIGQGGVPLPISALSFAPNGTLYGSAGPNLVGSIHHLGIIDLVAGTFSPLLALPPGVMIFGMDISPLGILYANYYNIVTQIQTFVTIDLSTLSIIDEKPILLFSISEMDYAPDGYIYHSNFSFALIRMDPTTAEQTFIGFGSLGPLQGIASIAAFSGLPGQANCEGKSTTALAKEFGGVKEAAASLGYLSVAALKNAIRTFCHS
jgi:hypothetical protein